MDSDELESTVTEVVTGCRLLVLPLLLDHLLLDVGDALARVRVVFSLIGRTVWLRCNQIRRVSLQRLVKRQWL